MVLLPIARPLRAPDGRAWKTLLFLTAVYAITVLTTPRWDPGYILGTVFITAALVWLPACAGAGPVARLDEPRRRRRAPRVMVLVSPSCSDGRSRSSTPNTTTPTRPPFLGEGGPHEGLRLRPRPEGQENRHHRLERDHLRPVRLLRRRANNDVDYIGVRGTHGSNRLPEDCRTFRRLINEGEYDYLIMSKRTQDLPDAEFSFPIYAWVKNSPARGAGDRRAGNRSPAGLRLQGQRASSTRPAAPTARPAEPSSRRFGVQRRARANPLEQVDGEQDQDDHYENADDGHGEFLQVRFRAPLLVPALGRGPNLREPTRRRFSPLR